MTVAMENRIVEQRRRIRTTANDLRQRVAASCYGPKTKEILFKSVEYESTGQVGFSLFDCPPAMVRGSGAIVMDADGKEYIDLLSGFAVSNVGQCNPEVVEVIREQAGKLIHYFDFPNLPRADLAETLASMAPGDFPKRVLFSVTGGEINDVAVKLARWYTGGQFILVPYGDYHGVTSGVMALTGKGGMWATYYPVLPGDGAVARFPYAYCYRCSFGKEYPSCELQCVKFLEQLFAGKESPFAEPKNRLTNVAALIVEPFQSSAGYIIPPKEFLVGLREFCNKYGILFISDEIQTGLGRTGKLWGVDHSGVIPDIITVSKSLADGLPIAAMIARSEILESWGPGAHVSTYAATPLAAAAANKVLEIVKRDRLPERAAEMGAYFLEGLVELSRRHPIVGHVDGKGLYLGLEFVRDRKTKEPADIETNFMTNECLKEGVIFEKGGYYYNRWQLIPPLVITKDQIDRVIAVFDRVFAKAERQYNIH